MQIVSVGTGQNCFRVSRQVLRHTNPKESILTLSRLHIGNFGLTQVYSLWLCLFSTTNRDIQTRAVLLTTWLTEKHLYTFQFFCFSHLSQHQGKGWLNDALLCFETGFSKKGEGLLLFHCCMRIQTWYLWVLDCWWDETGLLKGVSLDSRKLWWTFFYCLTFHRQLIN